MAGLKPVRVGNVLFVTKKETANELPHDPDLQQPAQPGQPGGLGGFAPGVAVAPNPPALIIGAPPAATAPTPAPPVDSGKLGEDKSEATPPDKDK